MSSNLDVIVELEELNSRLLAIERDNSLLRGIVASQLIVLGDVDISSYTAYVINNAGIAVSNDGIGVDNSNRHALVATNAAVSTSTIDSGDTAWMLSSCALVLFMCIPGGYQ